MERIEHIHRASCNEQTLKCLLQNNVDRKHSEWIVPIACFKAIHLAEAYCASSKQHFFTHESRLAYLKRDAEFTRQDQSGEDAYSSFYFLTWLCRHAMDLHNGYIAMPGTEEKQYFGGWLNKTVIEKHLRKIETFANHHGITIP